MASVRAMRNVSGLTGEKPTSKISRVPVRVLAERRGYASNNVVVGPQTTVRELSAVGGGLSRYALLLLFFENF